MTVQTGYCQNWLETPKTSFLASRLVYKQLLQLTTSLLFGLFPVVQEQDQLCCKLGLLMTGGFKPDIKKNLQQVVMRFLFKFTESTFYFTTRK